MATEAASYLDMLQATSGSWPRVLSRVSEPVSYNLVVPENLPFREASLIDAVLTLGYFPRELNAVQRKTASSERITESNLSRKLKICVQSASAKAFFKKS